MALEVQGKSDCDGQWVVFWKLHLEVTFGYCISLVRKIIIKTKWKDIKHELI